MDIGKISNELLQSAIFDHMNYKRDEVIIRPSVGEDCSVLQFDCNEQIVLSTDPITGATQNIGKLAVHISCNDVSTSGAEPVGILVTILLPPSSTQEDLETIMKDLSETSRQSNIEILGGHTEITDAVTRPVVSTTVIGKVKKDHMVATQGAQVGQDVILTKWAGLEGTSILAHEFEDKLIKILGNKMVDSAKEFGDFLSVVPESKIAPLYNVTSMHDVTEGGVLGAIWEVAQCAGVGMEVDLEKIVVKEETWRICEVFDISPYRLISSGCMIMTTFNGAQCVEQLKKQGIDCAIIGKVKKEGIYLIQDGKKQEIFPPESDELYKAFGKML